MKLAILFSLLSVMPLCFSSPGVGDKAPAFSLQASDGNTYALSQFEGQRGVVIAFFPKAFTGG